MQETISISCKACTIHSDSEPKLILLQPADSRELELLHREIQHIKTLTDTPFLFAAFRITDWNKELSPWNAPPVFGNEPFGSQARDTLSYIERSLIPQIISRYSLSDDIPIILGGYSLAGLFALWAAYSSRRFKAAAAVSPSVWFSGWLDFIAGHSPLAKSIYLSLGKKEEKTRNKAMATVGDNIRRQYEMLMSLEVNTTLEWNEGNHFTQPEIRTAKGFAWCCENILR